MARRSLRDEFIKRHGNRPAQMATYESDNDPRYEMHLLEKSNNG